MFERAARGDRRGPPRPPRELRAPRPRARDHARTGSSARGGRLRLLRRPLRRRRWRACAALRLPARARRHYLHLMPLLRAPAGAQRRRVRGRRLRRVDPRLGTMDDLEGLAAELRAARHGPLPRPRRQPHRARARVGAGRAARGTRTTATSTSRSPTAPSRTPTSARCRRSSPTPRRATSAGTRSSAAGSGRRSTRTSGTSTTPTRTASRPCSSRCSTSATAGWTSLRLDAVPFPWKGLGHQLPEPARGPPAAAGLRARSCASRRPASRSRRRRSSRRDELVAYLGAGRHEGKECDLAYHNAAHGAALERAGPRRIALLGAARRMPRCRRGTAWVTYVRCHDDIGWAITEEDAARGRRGRRAHRRFLADFYAGDFPGSFARGAGFQPDPVTGDARTSGRRLARRARGRARERRRRGRRAGGSAGCCCCTRSSSPTAACR